ncbi:MAG: hypothetical protein E7C36_13455 [Mixta calida]|uniref:hypothetical protein n=1 Tax=Mixta TaxID=2100764 RepID=UPI0025895597|nr:MULTISPECIES: hypothetical protein [Mixta]MDU3818539.1 hypothetical protein [Pantoea sp.]MCR1568284.1 hypothetical protein [Mixta sp.]MDU2734267.1 hypothetical protein [Mixta calida]MDU4291300.1 hypothetical protein [Mixta calida]MDU4943582.1 hypothetical protein [Mixta calida]
MHAVGASAPGFQEIAPEVYAAVGLYVDSRQAVWDASSCLQQARALGFLPQAESGVEPGERPDVAEEQINAASRTLFKSVGLAAQDLVFARAIVARQSMR